MPYEVSNPVKFYAGGDTTSQAIGKHIAEIARIYDILNDGLDSAKSVVVVLSPNTVLKDEQLGITPAPLEIKRGNGVQRWSELPDGIRLAQAIDNLTSDDGVAPLSARQGKLLKELIDAVPKTEVVDDLTTGGSGKALSAEQGKALKALIDALTTPVPGPPGPKGIEWRGAWDGAVAYRKDDAVSYRGGSYIALKPSTGEPPTNAEFWGVLSAKGADGAGSGDMTKAVYDPDGDGKVDAAVMADTAAVANSAKAVAWNDVTGKPEKFTCDIVDALDSDRADAALSAKQGKALKALIDTIPKTEVVDDLTTGGTDKALSAEQGKALKSLVEGVPKVEIVDALDSDRTDAALSAKQGKALKALIDASSGGGSGKITAEQLYVALLTSKWTVGPVVSDAPFYSLCWSSKLGMFCAVGDRGRIFTSLDGVTWKSADNQDFTLWVAGCWSPDLEKFCVVSSNGNKSVTSSDWVTWTIRNMPSGVWASVIWSSKRQLFCAVGTNCVATSPDGETWTKHTIPNGKWYAVCWSSKLEKFCAVSADGKAALSADGVSWTEHAMPAGKWYRVCWSSGPQVFCAVSYEGNLVAISKDGINWKTHETPTKDLYDVCWADELGIFCAVSYSEKTAITSVDGVTWKAKPLPETACRCVSWSPERGLFCIGCTTSKFITSLPIPL